MQNYNSNLSSLFGVSSDSLFGSVSLTDYASIKNGSYGKLVRSYYAEQKKAVSSSTSTDSSSKTETTSAAKKKTATDSTGMTALKKSADSLKSATEELGKASLWQKTAGEYDKEKIATKVKAFADQYNDTIAQASKVTSKEVAQSVNYMQSMTATMSNALSKVGVTVGYDGTLSVDTDKLTEADDKSLKALFGTKASYAEQIENYASDISKATVMNSSTYDSTGSATSALLSMFETTV